MTRFLFRPNQVQDEYTLTRRYHTTEGIPIIAIIIITIIIINAIIIIIAIA